MATYIVTDGSGVPVGTVTSKAAATKLIKADIWFRGDHGPYRLNDEEYAYVGAINLTRALIRSLPPVVKRTDSNVTDPRYPNGTPPVLTPVIFVATPPGLSLTAGASISQALASYVTGADASGYVMSLVPETGTLAGIGGTLTTTTLSGTAVEGSFTYRLRVTKGGYTFNAPEATQIVVAAAVSTDTLPTTIPDFLTLDIDTVTPKTTVSGDYPMDLRSASIGPTDNVSVELFKGTDGGTLSSLATKTAAGPQPSPIMAGSAIGTATLATFNQSGGNITISNVIDGLVSSAADNTNFYGGSITLPVGGRVRVTLPSYSGTYDYSEAALTIRQSLSPLAPCVRVVRRPDNLNDFAPLLSRSAQGAVLFYTADANVNGEVAVCIERLASDQWRLTQYDPAGTIITVGTCTAAMSGPVFVGVEMNRGVAGAAIAATFKNFAVNTQGRWTHVDTSVAQGHVYAYAAKGKDAASPQNASSIGSSVSGAITPVSGNAIKFHPGIYAWYLPPATPDGIPGYRFDLPVHRDAIIAFLNTLASEPTVRGIQVAGYPRAFEAETAGDYTAGKAALKMICDRAAQLGKYVLVRYEFGKFGNFASKYHIYPNYIADGNVGNGLGLSNLVSLQNGAYKGVTMRPWLNATRDRMLACFQSYAALFNSHPAFEELTLCGETSISVQDGVDGFSNTALTNSYLYMMPAARSYWPNTQLRIGINDMGTEANLVSLCQGAKASYVGLGGPDIWPGDVTQGDRIFAGRDYNGNVIYENMVGKLPWTVEAQDQSFASASRWPPAALWGAPVNGYTGTDDGKYCPPLKPTHIKLYVNEYAGDPINKWSTPNIGTLAFIRSVNGSVLPNLGPSSAVPAPTLYPAVNRS